MRYDAVESFIDFDFELVRLRVSNIASCLLGTHMLTVVWQVCTNEA